MAADPNWLLSAAAQSSAAVVAVVGGFITARLIGLASEKAALVSRRDEKHEELLRLDGELRRAIQSYDEFRVSRFLNDIVGELRESDPLPSLEEVSPKHEGDPLNAQILEDEYRSLRARITAAREWVASLGDLVGDGGPIFKDWLDKHNPDLAGVDIDEVEHAFHRECSRRRDARQQQQKATNYFWGGQDRIYVPESSDQLAARRDWAIFWTERDVRRDDDLRGRVESLQADVRLKTGERDETDARVRHFRYPGNYLVPLAILSFLGGIGVAVPLYLMPATTLEGYWKAFVVGGITAGLGALIIYLVHELRRLHS